MSLKGAGSGSPLQCSNCDRVPVNSVEFLQPPFWLGQSALRSTLCKGWSPESGKRAPPGPGGWGVFLGHQCLSERLPNAQLLTPQGPPCVQAQAGSLSIQDFVLPTRHAEPPPAQFSAKQARRAAESAEAAGEPPGASSVNASL